MKRITIYCIAMIIICINLFACGGSSGGSGEPGFVNSPESRINSDTPGYSSSEEAVVNSSGDGFATWRDSASNLLYSYYNGSSWSEGVVQAIGVRSKYTLTNSTTFAIVYQLSTSIRAVNSIDEGFDSPTLLASSSYAGMLQGYSAVSNGTGYAVAIQGGNGVFVNLYENSQWEHYSSLTQLDPDNGSILSVDVIATDLGYTVFWTQDNGDATVSLYANNYDGTSWEDPATLAPLNPTATGINNESFVSNSTGYAAAWVQLDADDLYSLYANTYNGAAWDDAASLISLAPSDMYIDSITIASNGTSYALAMSQYVDGLFNVYTNIYNDSNWQDPASVTLLDSAEDNSFSPELISNGTGYALAWQQYGATYGSAIHARMSGGLAWEDSVFISPDSSGTYVYEPSIATDGTGYAVAWYQQSAAGDDVYMNIYEASQWEDPSLLVAIDSGDEPILSVGALVTPNGYGALWLQDTDTTRSVYIAIEDAGTWLPQTNLTVAMVNGIVRYPKVAVNKSGVAVSVWTQYSGTNYEVWFSMAEGGVWGEPTALAQGLYPNIATDGDSFMVAWSYGGDVRYAMYDEGGFGDIDVLYSSTLSSSYPSVASSGNGYAVAWRAYSYGTEKSYVLANVYDGSGWQEKTYALISPSTAMGTVYYPSIETNGTGYAVVWTQQSPSGERSLYANIHNGTSWQDPSGLSRLSLQGLGVATTYILDPIASNGTGYAVTWYQNISGYKVYSNIYNGSSWQNPSSLAPLSISSGYYPSITSDGTGYAVAYREGVSDLNVNIYNGLSWQDSASIVTIDDSASSVYYPKITAGSTGYGVVWYQLDAGIMFNKYIEGLWQTAVSLESNSSYAVYPEVIPYGDGYAAVWLEGATSGAYTEIWGRLGF